ncbi:PB1-F2 protein [Influenza A virus]
MGQEQDTPWTQCAEHINTQKRENGRQTQKLVHLSSTRLMGHYLRIMNQVGMHKRTVF